MTTSLVRTRIATTDDLPAVLELYGRCSAQTLERRFHAPMAQVPDRLVRGLLTPPSGWSLVATQGEEVVGHGCAASVDEATVEIGLLVDDAFQGTGIGTRLMRDLAVSAAERGYDALVCSVEPDNDSVLPTVRRAGLQGLPRLVDGYVEIHVALTSRSARMTRPA